MAEKEEKTIKDAAKEKAEEIKEDVDEWVEVKVEDMGESLSEIKADAVRFVENRLPFQKGDGSEIGHNIVGLPPGFIDNTDPDDRAYMKFLLSDARVMTITPGVPKFFKTDADTGKVYKDKDLINSLGFPDGTSDSEIAKFLSKNFRNEPDFRYYGFQPAYTEYLRYTNILVSTVYGKMADRIGSSLPFSLKDEYDEGMFATGLSILLNSGVGINEVLSNDFGPSKIDGLAKSASGIAKEVKFLLGKADQTVDPEEFDEVDNEEVQEELQGLLSGGLLKKVFSLGGIGGVDKASTMVNGSHLLFPHVWNDSVFDRSYTITTTFHSPYGDPASIFRSVLIPFLSLITLALPRQDKFMGYTSPFICRVDCPGYFVSDMAVITSLTWVKGGSNKLFTKDGFPREIEVNITIRDLYPVLMMSKSFGFMKSSNMGMLMFLENLAGLGIDDVSLKAGINSFFQRNIGRVISVPESFSKSIGSAINEAIKIFK